MYQGTKEPGVFKYCIQRCRGRCHVEHKGKESGKEMMAWHLWRAVQKTVRKGAALGRLRVTLMLFLSHCLSASPWKESLLVVLVAVRPLWTPGHQWSKAQQELSLTFRGSSAPRPRVSRWRVMPQGHSQFPHTTRISRANLSPSLSNSTTFHVLPSIPCPLLSSPSTASTTQCQLEPTSSRWGDNLEGWFSKRNLQKELAETKWFLVQGGRCPLPAMSQHGRCSWAPVAGPVPPTKPTTWK